MEQKPIDLLVGPKAIAEATGLTYYKVYSALKRGDLPAKQLNGRWVISRTALERFFNEAAA